MEIHLNTDTIEAFLTTYGAAVLADPSFATYDHPYSGTGPPVAGTQVFSFASAAMPGVIVFIDAGGIAKSAITAIVSGATLAPVDDLR